MKALNYKRQVSRLRSQRVRSRIRGSAERPRLSVNISHRHVSAQLIDDDRGLTLAYATTVGNRTLSENLTAKAQFVGVAISERAKKAKIKKVIFDRGGRKYHGRLDALAKAAREGGLEF
ncbi:50S ribosomal protein L18 [Candidatus Saccharibacteria bacterium RIFCSPHIGHO2_12_FULL_49_19]|nr:MAG: 50S ribosomal protein L18 [Candidatus Saccharibacteria bacterium RIFCSPHIGHO2_01_FULL_49_21]OGL37784.1 MAG: 50S ribosomal protein L18 [Candidatus Saccharibacteria bacterium RIFCSPHIGHO2_12_FULL_49_19]OGL38575.1 MAG: 50S ribosomal protein L18 [Candidatus Saccharibacteria bacterium RIFCSPLOWO2_01_FULL_49_22]